MILHGSDAERTECLQHQGELIALFIDGIIQEHAIPNKVAVAGWSLGNIFSIGLLTSIDRLPEAVKERLKTHIRSLFL